MIQKIKDLMQISENIDSLKQKTDDMTQAFVSMQKEVQQSKQDFNSLKAEFTELRERQQEFLKSFKIDIEQIKTLKTGLDTEVKDFKLVKGQMQEKLFQQIREELDQSINANLEGLKTDVSRYNELKQQIGLITLRISTLGTEIDKFNNISRKLKEGDFELSNYAKKIMEMDHEKMQLLRKIDALERLISRERRIVR